MIKLNELKIGDYVLADYNGKLWEGEVIGLSPDDNKANILTEVQEFWYEVEHLHPIPLNEEQLLRLQFEKEPMPDESVKYKKGSFRIVTPQAGNFEEIEMWYREDRRHHPNVHFVHQLQNQYMDMTKVHLTTEAM